MSCKIRNIANSCHCGSGEELAKICNREILDSYPGLRLRWVRIYGHRWSYLFGNSDEICMNAKKIRLNGDYGIYIDHHEGLDEQELGVLIAALKRCFQ
ncbi:MAG: hypothetical protein HQP61_06025 [Peptococcaceae bacterium]|nr:hypothetical protein [Candidatus Syntrophopropionicum ammoniitolerans]